jgi:hypothetical protein
MNWRIPKRCMLKVPDKGNYDAKRELNTKKRRSGGGRSRERERMWTHVPEMDISPTTDRGLHMDVTLKN